VEAALETCPDCGSAVDVHPGFTPWCECGWNLDLPQGRAPGSFDRLLSKAAHRLDRRLGEAVRRSDLQPRLTVAKGTAYAISAGVYLVALGLIAAGVFLALAVRGLLGIFCGVALVLIGVLMRPRFGKAPTDGVVSRGEAPTLYELTDEIAQGLGTPRIDILVVDGDYNASWSIEGLRRKRVLTLGLPLLTALDPQERVALIAHELAHARNGDSTRGLLVGGALNAIAEVYAALVRGADSLSHSDWAILEWVSRSLLWLLSRPVLALYYVLWILLLRDSQRAEYLADALAAQVAGTQAQISSQEKLLLESVFETTALRVARSQEGDLFAEFRAAIDGVPPRERERRRRLSRLEGVHLSATHPPTARRLELIESRPNESGKVHLTSERSTSIDDALEPLREHIAADIADDYRATLYGLN
jgi:Zn-dependent protease with chaperone function